MSGFPQSSEIAQATQGTMHLSGNVTEPRFLPREGNLEGLQSSHDVSITFAFDPQPMQSLAAQVSKTVAISGDLPAPLTQSRLTESIDALEPERLGVRQPGTFRDPMIEFHNQVMVPSRIELSCQAAMALALG